LIIVYFVVLCYDLRLKRQPADGCWFSFIQLAYSIAQCFRIFLTFLLSIIESVAGDLPSFRASSFVADPARDVKVTLLKRSQEEVG